MNKESNHISSSAHIDMEIKDLLRDNNQNTDSSYLQVELNERYKYRGTLLELHFYSAVFVSVCGCEMCECVCSFPQLIKIKCTSQPWVVVVVAAA